MIDALAFQMEMLANWPVNIFLANLLLSPTCQPWWAVETHKRKQLLYFSYIIHTQLPLHAYLALYMYASTSTTFFISRCTPRSQESRPCLEPLAILKWLPSAFSSSSFCKQLAAKQPASLRRRLSLAARKTQAPRTCRFAAQSCRYM